MYPEERYFPSSIDDVDRDIAELKRARQEMITRGSQKPMDAKDEQLVNFAHEAGAATALYRAEKEKNKQLTKDLAEAQEAAEGRDGWRDSAKSWQRRAEVAEEKLAKKRKRARR